MACIGSGRFCVRVFEKLCHNVQFKEPMIKVYGSYGFQQLRNFNRLCQVRIYFIY